MAELDAGTLIGSALQTIEGGLADVAAPALYVGAAVVALRVAWVFARRLMMEGFAGDGGSSDCGNGDCFHSVCDNSRQAAREDRW